MKKAAVKKLSAVLLSIIIMFTLAVNTYAETVQDRLERQLQELLEKYQSSDSESQASIQERFNAFLEENGLSDIDLSDLQNSDIAGIIAGLGDNFSMDRFSGLAGDAWNSALAMIQDAFGGGNGTSDGKNTANTTSPQYTSPNVIVSATSAVSDTQAAGIPSTVIPPVSSEQITNPTTVPNIVGAGITTAEPAVNDNIINDSGINSSSVIVLTVLSVSTVAVIIAIVVFFVLKRR